MASTKEIDNGVTKHFLACFGACGSAVPTVSYPEAGNGLPGVSQPLAADDIGYRAFHFGRH